MIVEVIVSTLDAAGRPNYAPMGVLWGEDEITVRPFRRTQTCRNLLATGYGVVSTTDDVLAFVQSALYDATLPHFPASVVPGVVFQGACSWRELEVAAAEGTADRAEVRCRVVGKGWQRDFLGFCRARNAVIEATILATRLHLQDLEAVSETLERCEEIVRKTGDEVERVAMQGVHEYVRRWMSEHRR
jgi:uncharacterized protein